MSLADDYKAEVAATKSKSTAEVYHSAANQFLSFLGAIRVAPADISQKHLQDFVLSLVKGGASPNSVRLWGMGAFRFCRWLTSRGVLKTPLVSPETPKIKNKKLHALTDGDYAAVMGEFLKLAEPYRTMSTVMSLTGMRVSEVVGLTSKSFRATHDGHVMFKIAGKGGKPREVPMVRRGNALFKNYLLTYYTALLKKSNTPWLFPSPKSPLLPVSVARMEERLRVIKARLGIVQLTPHTMRRTWATRLHRAGVDPLTIQALLGHAKLSTTAIYTDVNENQLCRAVSTLDT